MSSDPGRWRVFRGVFMVPANRSSLMRIIRNLIPLAITASLIFITTKLHLHTDWIMGAIVDIVIFVAALVLPYRMKPMIAFAILSVMLAPVAVEFVAHLVYGIRAVQGGPVHITLFATATVGLLLGLATKKAGANAGPSANVA